MTKKKLGFFFHLYVIMQTPMHLFRIKLILFLSVLYIWTKLPLVGLTFPFLQLCLCQSRGFADYYLYFRHPLCRPNHKFLVGQHLLWDWSSKKTPQLPLVLGECTRSLPAKRLPILLITPLTLPSPVWWLLFYCRVSFPLKVNDTLWFLSVQ